MKSKIKDIEIPDSNPFGNDKLGRLEYANTLTSIIEVYGESGGVLSINGEWGTGKTTFISMWRQHLENQSFHTFYFNAWESDFADDPLVSLIAEFKKISTGTDEEPFKALITNGAKIVTSATSALFNTILKTTTGLDHHVLDNVTDTIKGIGDSWIEEYEMQKEAFSDFKQYLNNFVADKADAKHPIVFFVDELDRCNPTYAVKTLERIKHLFDISNLIFILSINKKQLACSIQGYFGSEKMNADEYLRKFIDLEYNLPAPDMHKYCTYLFDEYDIWSFFCDRQTRNIEASDFIQMSSVLGQHCNMNLRELNKLYAHASIALSAFSSNGFFSVYLFYYLCFIRVCQTELFNKIKSRNYHSIQSLFDDITSNLPISLLDSTNHKASVNRSVIYAIAGVLIGYNVDGCSEPFDPEFKGTKKEGLRYESFPITSGIVNQDILFEALTSYQNSACYLCNFGGLLDKVDLLCYLNIH